MDHKQILPNNFTPTIGSYSHVTCIQIGDGKLLFTTGQIAMDSNGDVVSNDVAEQTDFVFKNLMRILEAEGMTFENAVKVQIFVTDMNDFGEISPVRNHYLGDGKPVSTLVEVNRLVKDGCKVEIEITAYKSLK